MVLLFDDAPNATLTAVTRPYRLDRMVAATSAPISSLRYMILLRSERFWPGLGDAEARRVRCGLLELGREPA